MTSSAFKESITAFFVLRNKKKRKPREVVAGLLSLL